MELVGTFSGEEVRYSKSHDILYCKNIAVYFQNIERMIMNKEYRTKLEKDVYLIKKDKTYTIGCLEDTYKNFNTLYNKIRGIKYSTN